MDNISIHYQGPSRSLIGYWDIVSVEETVCVCSRNGLTKRLLKENLFVYAHDKRTRRRLRKLREMGYSRSEIIDLLTTAYGHS